MNIDNHIQLALRTWVHVSVKSESVGAEKLHLHLDFPEECIWGKQ